MTKLFLNDRQCDDYEGGYPFSSTRKAVSSQASRRVYPFSSTAIVHVCTPRQRCRSRLPHGLRCGSAAARLLGLRVRIPPGVGMALFCESCRWRPLRRADYSSRGVLLSAVCLSVIVKPRQEEALAHYGLLRHGIKYPLQ
jgi:hypothetical protein